MKTKPDRKFDLNTNDRTLEIGAQVSPQRKSHRNDENFTRQLVQKTTQYMRNLQFSNANFFIWLYYPVVSDLQLLFKNSQSNNLCDYLLPNVENKQLFTKQQLIVCFALLMTDWFAVKNKIPTEIELKIFKYGTFHFIG
ncbi:hypothetical protein T10_11139 [Trichinella papuae]|uniref:Uncharacterized protein n=1 Tax=Trichinella papuae TaxID=268474 RepID=A0A0V1N9F7_9BILA|nr:hypothetical protein T10_11139 [Trichinella papuae]